MHLTEFSMLMAILWSSVIIVFNYLCGRKQPILRQFGIRSLLALYLLSALRMDVYSGTAVTRGVQRVL